MEHFLLILWGIAPRVDGCTAKCSAEGIYVTSLDSFFAIVFDGMKKQDPQLSNSLGI